jgi:hypothetical protein
MLANAPTGAVKRSEKIYEGNLFPWALATYERRADGQEE